MEQKQTSNYLGDCLDLVHRFLISNVDSQAFPGIAVSIEDTLLSIAKDVRHMQHGVYSDYCKSLISNITEILEKNKAFFSLGCDYETDEQGKKVLVYKKLPVSHFQKPETVCYKPLRKPNITQKSEDNAGSVMSNFKIACLNSTLKFVKLDSQLVLKYPNMSTEQADLIKQMIEECQARNMPVVAAGFRGLYDPLCEALQIYSLKYDFVLHCETSGDVKQLKFEKIKKLPDKNEKENLDSDSSSIDADCKMPTKKQRRQIKPAIYAVNANTLQFKQRVITELNAFLKDKARDTHTFANLSMTEHKFVTHWQALTKRVEVIRLFEVREQMVLDEIRDTLKSCNFRIKLALDENRSVKFTKVTLEQLKAAKQESTTSSSGNCSSNTSFSSTGTGKGSGKDVFMPKTKDISNEWLYTMLTRLNDFLQNENEASLILSMLFDPEKEFLQRWQHAILHNPGLQTGYKAPVSQILDRIQDNVAVNKDLFTIDFRISEDKKTMRKAIFEKVPFPDKKPKVSKDNVPVNKATKPNENKVTLKNDSKEGDKSQSETAKKSTHTVSKAPSLTENTVAISKTTDPRYSNYNASIAKKVSQEFKNVSKVKNVSKEKVKLMEGLSQPLVSDLGINTPTVSKAPSQTENAVAISKSTDPRYSNYNASIAKKVSQEKVKNVSKENVKNVSKENVKNVSKEKVKNVSKEKVKNVSKDNVKNVSKEKVQNVSKENVKNVSKENVKKLFQEQVKNVSKKNVKNVSKEKVKKVSQENVNNVSKENVKNVSKEKVQKVSQEKVKNVSKEKVKNLSKENVKNVSKEKVKKVSQEKVKNVPKENVKNVPKENVKNVSKEKVKNVSKENVKNVSKEKVQKVSQEKVKNVSKEKVKNLSKENVKNVSKEKVKKGSQNKVKNVPKENVKNVSKEKVKKLSQVKVKNVSKENVKNASKEKVKKVPQEKVKNVSKENVKNVSKEKVKKVSQEKVNNVSKENVKNVSKEKVQKVSQEKVKNVSKERVKNLSKENVKNVSKEKVKKVSQEKVKNVPKENVKIVSKEKVKKVSQEKVKNVSKKNVKNVSKEKLKLMKGLSQPLVSNVGMKMMRQMGWEGGALGLRGQGIVEPIMPPLDLAKGAGLGAPKAKLPKVQARAIVANIPDDTIRVCVPYSPGTNELKKGLLETVLKMTQDGDEKPAEITFPSKLTLKQWRYMKFIVTTFNNRGPVPLEPSEVPATFNKIFKNIAKSKLALTACWGVSKMNILLVLSRYNEEADIDKNEWCSVLDFARTAMKKTAVNVYAPPYDMKTVTAGPVKETVKTGPVKVTAKAALTETANAGPVKETAKAALTETANAGPVKDTVKAALTETVNAALKEPVKPALEKTVEAALKETVKAALKETVNAALKETLIAALKAAGDSSESVMLEGEAFRYYVLSQILDFCKQHHVFSKHTTTTKIYHDIALKGSMKPKQLSFIEDVIVRLNAGARSSSGTYEATLHREILEAIQGYTLHVDFPVPKNADPDKPVHKIIRLHKIFFTNEDKKPTKAAPSTSAAVKPVNPINNNCGAVINKNIENSNKTATKKSQDNPVKTTKNTEEHVNNAIETTTTRNATNVSEIAKDNSKNIIQNVSGCRDAIDNNIIVSLNNDSRTIEIGHLASDRNGKDIDEEADCICCFSMSKLDESITDLENQIIHRAIKINTETDKTYIPCHTDNQFDKSVVDKENLPVNGNDKQTCNDMQIVKNVTMEEQERVFMLSHRNGHGDCVDLIKKTELTINNNWKDGALESSKMEVNYVKFNEKQFEIRYGKRQRSAVNTPEKLHKKSRYNFVKNLSIMPKDVVQTVMTNKMAATVQNEILNSIDYTQVELPLLKCHGIENGALSYSCHNEKSWELIQNVIESLNLKFTLNDGSQKETFKVSFRINTFIDECLDSILERLEGFNPTLTTKDWVFLKKEQYSDCTVIFVDIDSDSLKFIRSEHFKLYVGIDEAQFSVVWS